MKGKLNAGLISGYQAAFGWADKHLAGELGLTRQAVTHMKKAQSTKMSTLIKLAGVLGCSVEDLILKEE